VKVLNLVPVQALIHLAQAHNPVLVQALNQVQVLKAQAVRANQAQVQELNIIYCKIYQNTLLSMLRGLPND